MPWKVSQLPPGDARLNEVISIWGINRSTLGLFPKGAFDDCIAQQRLVIATDDSNQVVGYLTFRFQRKLNAAVVIHLCVRTECRGRGVADALANWLKAHARGHGFSALRLKCRRDYHAQGLWQRLGFIARGDIVGRGRDGEELTVWVHALGPVEDLFSLAEESIADDRITAVMDANVFYDLHGDDAETDSESRVLLEPWVTDAVKLHLVDEIHNEIDRHLIAEKRDEYHRTASNYPEAAYDDHVAAGFVTTIDEVLGRTAKKENERSDRKQLARSAAAGVNVFLTRDQELLDAAETLSARLQIQVLRPTELACGLDETERVAAYQPARLFATAYTQSALRATDVEAVVDRVHHSHLGEKPGSLANTIRCLLGKVRSSSAPEVSVIRDSENRTVALVARTPDTATGTAEISVFRVGHDSLERTLVRQLLLQAIQANAVSKLQKLIVSDAFMSNTVKEALLELAFEKTEVGWVRYTPNSVGIRGDLLSRLSDSGVGAETLRESAPAELETRFWPAKVLGEGIPTFVVPIIPTWAAQLFDSDLAESELFGAMARIALNRENVYYRRPKNGHFTLPARILWYVKKEEGVDGTMAIRACSRLVSVETGPAKTLYSKYRRLGVYEWREILATAKGDPFGEIMVLRFADTEQFRAPVALETLQALGISSIFPSPTKITEEQFAEIYRRGFITTSK